ncbi:MAG: nucleotidyltransferase domain-containing protein [Desulfobacterales bacterium]|nr:nucleotidyltransferase domain-containing protein [Desulfobacterales bacterium]
MFFTKMNDNQRRIFIDTAQLYEAYFEVLIKNQAYRGGMHWKKAKGHEYLFRTRDRYGYGKSLGARSPETEKIITVFKHAKEDLKKRLATLKEKLNEQARFCKAAMLQRAPRIVTNILRILQQYNMLGKNLTVVGTNALYAYEAAAGIFLDTSVTATKDMDLLWDVRPRLAIASNQKTQNKGLIEILKKVDKSFELIKRYNFRAVNKDGYMVDLIKAEPKNVFKVEKTQIGDEEDFRAAEIKNLQWLISSPKMSQIVIGNDGYPSLFVVPDPISFALHKLWLSDQIDREPVKKERDRNQAVAVANLVNQFLPQYKFKKSELRMFPYELEQT